jgi:integrase/recombinase XerD
MAKKRKSVALYIRGRSGYSKPPKQLVNLPEGEVYYIFWWENGAKQTQRLDRFADAAQVAQINKEGELRRAAVGTKPVVSQATPAVEIALVTPEQPAEPTTESASKNVSDAVTKYLAEVRRNKARKTWLAYSITLQGFLPVCIHKTLDTLDRDDTIAYKDALTAQGLDKTTIANRLDFLKTFFNYLELKWPMKKTDKVKRTKKTVKAYTKQRLESLFAVTTQEETELFQFFLFTGGREQDVMHATWPDMDYDRKKFFISEKTDANLVWTPKDKEEAGIPVPDDFLELMKERRKRYPNTRLIFSKNGKPDGHFLKTLQKLALREGLNCGNCYNKKGKCCVDTPCCKEWGLHKFRKTFATMHHSNGVPVRKIQRWLRHSDLETTLRYLADSEDEDEGTRMTVNGTFSFLRPKAAAMAA